MWDMSKSKLVEAQAEWTHRKREDQEDQISEQNKKGNKRAGPGEPSGRVCFLFSRPWGITKGVSHERAVQPQGG